MLGTLLEDCQMCEDSSVLYITGIAMVQGSRNRGAENGGGALANNFSK